MSRVGSVRTVQKMNPGTMSGQSRAAQPFAFAINPKPKRKAAPFIPGLRAWYDASDLSTIICDGSFGVNRVTTLLDKGGRGYHLTSHLVPAGQGGNSAPLTGTDSKNGLNVLTFNNTTGPFGHAQDYLSHRDKSHFNFMHGNLGCTVFLVVYNIDVTPRSSPKFVCTTGFNLGTFLDGDIGIEVNASTNQFTGTDGVNLRLINPEQGGNETNIDMTAGPWTAASSPWHIHVHTTNPTKPANSSTGPRGQIFLDGSNTSPPSAGTGNAPELLGAHDSASWFSIGLTDLGGLVLGTRQTPPAVDGVWSLSGLHGWRFAECRIYEGVLLDAQWQSVRNELDAKWAVY